LRRIREESGRTQKAVAESLGWSTSKVIRIETGAVHVSTSDVMALLHFYGVSDQALTGDLLAITRAKEQSWWDEYRATYDQQFINFLGYEDSASTIRQFISFAVPGLLQTEEYMTALFSRHKDDPERVARGIKVRLHRQQLLTREDAPRALFVLDEAAIHRWIGGPAVLRRQLARLKEVARLPNVSIQIVRFSQGVHPGMRGSFTIFEFPSDDEDFIVNLEDPHRDVLIRDDPEVSSEFVETFAELQEIASKRDELDTIIDSLMESMRLDT
jgi:transcriptional regulator with XRE-family HTH domain